MKRYPLCFLFLLLILAIGFGVTGASAATPTSAEGDPIQAITPNPASCLDGSPADPCMRDQDFLAEYKAWKSRVGDPGPFSVQLVQGAAEKGSLAQNLFCIMVNATLRQAIQPSLDTFLTDLTADGYTPQVYSWSGGTPEDLRAFLQARYAEGMVGTLFVGDLPIAWYKDGDAYIHPTDQFYMDMDGVYRDLDEDGIYDAQSGNTNIEVYFGRLTASPLTYTGESETDLVRKYFHKDHLYRTKQLELPHRALEFTSIGTEIDSVRSCDHCNVLRAAYPEQRCEWRRSKTNAHDYEYWLGQGYELVEYGSHGSPDHHTLNGECDSVEATHTWYYDIIDSVTLRSHFLTLFSCVTGSYVHPNYIAGWYIFSHDYGLVTIACTRTGGFIGNETFYASLGAGNPIGVAFYDMNVGGAGIGANTLFGDPTLRAVYCDVALGDGDNDGVADDCDNCPDIPNPDQTDVDHDYLGDMCDNCIDTDDDGYGNPEYQANICPDDNCPVVYNPDQKDFDGDGIGDACDPCTDIDGDGFGDPGYAANTCTIDNCPDIPNPNQADADNDGIGDMCDNCVTSYNPDQADPDQDGIGSACDNCPYAYNPNQQDSDANGQGNACDCYGMAGTVWVSTHDDGSHDALYAVQQISSGYYMAAGGAGDSATGFYEVLYNQCGQVVWFNKKKTSMAVEIACDIDQTSDNGFIASGTIGAAWYLLKRNSARIETWDFKGNSVYGVRAYAVCEGGNGDFVMVGSGLGGAIIVWRDSECQSGGMRWLGAFGDALHDVKALSNGGYIAAGFRTNAAGRKEVWLVKLDSYINTVWEARPGITVNVDDIAYGIDPTQDGGYVIAGARINDAGLGDCLVMKVAADSHLVWVKTGGSAGDDVGHSIHILADGGFVVGGYSNGNDQMDYDGFFARVDKNGNFVRQWWDNLPGEQKGYDIDVTSDNLYIIAGESNGDFYLNKFGNFTAGGDCCVLAGDANHDGVINIGDMIYIINYTLKGGPPPVCQGEADANGDCTVNVGDALYLRNYIFSGGPAPVCNSNCEW